jgi:hypothetical protein
MAIKFKNVTGKAKKSSAEAYTYKDGDNTVRLVGDILPRYVYWTTTTDNKRVPMECLAFDREQERFANLEKDWVQHYFPDLKCSWAYAAQVVDEGKLKVLNLKKKLFEQILTASEDLGDPTDPESGWDIRFKKVKTGPLPFNVEYQLQVLKCKPRPLSAEELEATKQLKPVDEIVRRPTADEQKVFIEQNILEGGGTSEVPTEVAEEIQELL